MVGNHQTSILKWLFRVPGSNNAFRVSLRLKEWTMMLERCYLKSEFWHTVRKTCRRIMLILIANFASKWRNVIFQGIYIYVYIYVNSSIFRLLWHNQFGNIQCIQQGVLPSAQVQARHTNGATHWRGIIFYYGIINNLDNILYQWVHH